MIVAQRVVNSAKAFVWDGPERQEADCIIGLIGVDPIRWSHKNEVIVLAPAEGWCPAQLNPTCHCNVRGMNGLMFVWILLAVRQGGPCDMVGSPCPKRQSVCVPHL